jgi:hypothetical protein
MCRKLMDYRYVKMVVFWFRKLRNNTNPYLLSSSETGLIILE